VFPTWEWRRRMPMRVGDEGLDTRNELIDGAAFLASNAPKRPVVVAVEGETNSFVKLLRRHMMGPRDVGNAHPRPHLFRGAMQADRMTDGV